LLKIDTRLAVLNISQRNPHKIHKGFELNGLNLIVSLSLATLMKRDFKTTSTSKRLDISM
jgi:hypothetical protein